MLRWRVAAAGRRSPRDVAAHTPRGDDGTSGCGAAPSAPIPPHQPTHPRAWCSTLAAATTKRSLRLRRVSQPFMGASCAAKRHAHQGHHHHSFLLSVYLQPPVIVELFSSALCGGDLFVLRHTATLMAIIAITSLLAILPIATAISGSGASR